MAAKPKEPENAAGQQARQHYLEQARRVVGEANLDYAALYQRFAQNDWAAIKLDDSVALAALKAVLAQGSGGDSASESILTASGAWQPSAASADEPVCALDRDESSAAAGENANGPAEDTGAFASTSG
jgi:hypothetical protein